MKLTICAIAAITVSLTHTQLKPEDTVQSESSAPTASCGVVSVSNHEGGNTFHMVAQTNKDTSYQPWCSSDQENWTKYGEPFTGNGSLRVVSIQKREENPSGQIFVRIEAE